MGATYEERRWCQRESPGKAGNAGVRETNVALRLDRKTNRASDETRAAVPCYDLPIR